MRTSDERHPRRALRAGTALGICALAGWAPALAATLDIQVRERGGSGLPNRMVCAQQVQPWGWSHRDLRCTKTGAAGKASIPDLPKGEFRLYVDSPQDADLVPTKQNPWVPDQRIAVGDDAERLAAVLELQRGIPVWVEVRNEHGEFPKGLLADFIVREPSLTAMATMGIPETGKLRVLVPRGKFLVALRHPPSHALVGLDVDGTPSAETKVELDLAVDPRPRYLTWTLTTGGWLSSRVEFVGVTDCAGKPVAHPTEGSLPPVPLGKPGSPCDYESWVPAGKWRVTVEGEGIVSSVPPFVDVEIGAGTEARADFRVEARERDAGATIDARLLDPGGDELPNGVVEARAPEGESALARAHQDFDRRYPPFRLTGLEEGRTYRVVGSHADWLPSEDKATAVDSENSRPPLVSLTLRPGAAVRARAVGIDGAPRAGVSVRLERAEPLPPSRSEDPLAPQRSGRVGSTDVSGVVQLRGLLSGKHRITAAVPGGSGEEVSPEIEIEGEDGDGAPARTVNLTEGKTVQVVVRLVSAARLTGSVRCNDPWPTPAKAEVRVYADEDLAAFRGVAPRNLMFLLPNWPPVTGAASTDAVSVGSLGRGVYRVAVVPEGVWAWSWYPGDLRIEEGKAIQVDGPGEVDLGTIEVECGPVLMLRPAALDLEGVALSDGVLALEVRPVREDATGEPVPLRVDSGSAEFIVRGLPEGSVEITGRATHPFLVPGAVEMGPIRKTLERGGAWTVDLPFQGVGGAVEIRTGAAAVRIAAEDGTSRVAPTKDGVAFFGGVPAGTWKVEACADASCGTSEPAGLVSVAPARTTVYREPASTP